MKRLPQVVDPVNDVDRGISRRIAALPPSRLDTVMKGLTTMANHSVLWFAIAAGLALRRGATRKAAARGVLAIALASGTANAVCKPLLPRRRPARRDGEPQEAVVGRRREALHDRVEPARGQCRDASRDAAVEVVDRVDHLQEPLHRADPNACSVDQHRGAARRRSAGEPAAHRPPSVTRRNRRHVR